jgi:SAM-dependent methyltransferase
MRPLSPPRISDWQLPQGVPRGTWEYAHSRQIAATYDERLNQDGLCQLELAVIQRHFTQPGLLVDLGCGTGRLLFPFARRGFSCLAVDLSPEMLAIVAGKASREGLVIDRLLANLVQLDCLRDAMADYALCMFSALGMIRGRQYRRQALRHVRRILKPGGTFVLHVHNRWSNLWLPQGRGWVLRNLAASLWRPDMEAGDKFFDYQDVPNMFLHLYTRRELLADLRQAGLRVVELVPLDAQRQEVLCCPWLLSPLRAGGWIAVCV